MARNDKHRFRKLRIGSRQDGVDIFQMRRLIAGSLAARLEFVHHDLQPTARVLGNFIQARHDVIPTASYAASDIGPR